MRSVSSSQKVSNKMQCYFDGVAQLPNQWASSIDFDAKITCMNLSHHGFMLAVGLDQGDVYVCDSETGGNRRLVGSHSSKILDVSFDRTGRLLASGDVSGTVIVREVLSGKEEGKERSPSGIVREILSEAVHQHLCHWRNSEQERERSP